MAFVKIHDSILASSIVEEDPVTRWVWLFMLVKCDKNGNVYGTWPALARMANVDDVEFETAMATLMAPDASSTSQLEDGRRIIEAGPNLLHVVNYLYYRGLKDPDEVREGARLRKQKQREREKAEDVQADSPESHKKVTESHDKAEAYSSNRLDKAEAEADTSTHTEDGVQGLMDIRLDEDAPPPDKLSRFGEFWDLYPRRIQRARAESAWKKLTKAQKQAAIDAVPHHCAMWARQAREKDKVPYPATWLNGKSWEDEIWEEKSRGDLEWEQAMRDSKRGVFDGGPAE